MSGKHQKLYRGMAGRQSALLIEAIDPIRHLIWRLNPVVSPCLRFSIGSEVKAQTCSVTQHSCMSDTFSVLWPANYNLINKNCFSRGYNQTALARCLPIKGLRQKINLMCEEWLTGNSIFPDYRVVLNPRISNMKTEKKIALCLNKSCVFIRHCRGHELKRLGKT